MYILGGGLLGLTLPNTTRTALTWIKLWLCKQITLFNVVVLFYEKNVKKLFFYNKKNIFCFLDNLKKYFQ